MSRSSISSSDASAPLRFGLRGLLFVAPLLALWSLVEFWFWNAGESRPAASVVEAQSADPKLLFGRGVLSQQFNVFKEMNIRQRKAAMLIVGSSRSMQLRPRCLGKRARAYNAGGILQSLADLEALAQLFSRDLPRPQQLIIVLDPWWFKQGNVEQSWLLDDRLTDEARLPVARVTALQRFSKQPGTLMKFWSSQDPRVLSGYHPLGFGARLGDGFRADGSYRYGRHLLEFAREPVYRDREQPPVSARVSGETIQYTRGPYDPELEGRLVQVLAGLQGFGIKPMILMPPHAPLVSEQVAAVPWMTKWFDEFYLGLAERLRGRGFAVASARSGSDLGMPNQAFFDGMHPGEVVMAKLLLGLVPQLDADLGASIDGACASLVKRPASPLLLEGD